MITVGLKQRRHSNRKLTAELSEREFCSMNGEIYERLRRCAEKARLGRPEKKNTRPNINSLRTPADNACRIHATAARIDNRLFIVWGGGIIAAARGYKVINDG